MVSNGVTYVVAVGAKAGFSLYTFNNDQAGPSTCYGGCAANWPAYTIANASNLKAPAGVNLGTSVRTDGSIQVTLNNEPLYYYSGDQKAGDTNGQGLGGVWFLADVPSASSAASVSSTASSTVSNSSSSVVSAGNFGIDAAQMLYHVDGGQTGGWAYLCLDGNCSTATKVGNRYQRQISIAVGSTHTIEFKVQDNATGQCLSGVQTVTYVAGGVTAPTVCLIPDVTAPSIPTTLKATSKNGNAASLTWTASTDNRGVTKYDIYRNAVVVGSSTSNGYIDSGLSGQTTYSYLVRACDAVGNCSAQSTAYSHTTPIYQVDTTPPIVPTGLVSSNLTDTGTTISWTASTDALGNVVKYNVTQGSTLIASTQSTSFTTANLASGSTYSFTVNACDDAGNCSAQSATLSVTTSVTPIKVDTTTNSNTHHDVGPSPRPNPPDALATPINGASTTEYGFAFDINGSQLSWRWGSSIVKSGGDSSLEMWCSSDGDLTFKKSVLNGGTLTIPCAGSYNYFFRYMGAYPLNNNLATQWIYTGKFTTAGARIDVKAYPSFTDGSANWMRWRHPITNDGITAAVLDAQHNSSQLRYADRYTVWVDDKPGNVLLTPKIHPYNGTETPSYIGLARVESMRSGNSGPNGQQYYANERSVPLNSVLISDENTRKQAWGNLFSYGQVIPFEITAVAGGLSSQTYNDLSYYTIGLGWGNYGDPRLTPAGKAGTTMFFSDSGQFSALEYNAEFTQPLVTLSTEDQVDEFILGHHIFHGIDPTKKGSSLFDDPAVQIGKFTCGHCHFRDGRGSEVIQTPRGPRIAPPVYGIGLLQAIEGRTAGFGWNGQDATIKSRIQNALIEDHGIKVAALPQRAFDLIDVYVESLTVPNRNPNSYDLPGVAHGEALFGQVGCSNCHTPIQHTKNDSLTPSQVRSLTIRPYTDMKTWAMNGGTFRTPPLWGLGNNLDLLKRNGRAVMFLHDGSATTVDGAIQKHDNSGASVRTSYNALSPSDRTDLVNFVLTL